MFELVCVTNRALCGGNFLRRIEALAAQGIDRMILREKDMAPQAYEALAKEVRALCAARGTPLALHAFAGVAQRVGADALHLSLPALAAQPALRAQFARIGVSVHSLAQARQAAALGADYLVAGHVFATACKEGLAPRGLDFLADVCAGVSVPVYAIGGVSAENLSQVRQAGARGACVMSSLMTCTDIPGCLAALRGGLQKA